MTPTAKKFFAGASVFFIDGFITGGIGALATGDIFSALGLRVFAGAGLISGLSSLRHFLDGVKGEFLSEERTETTETKVTKIAAVPPVAPKEEKP